MNTPNSQFLVMGLKGLVLGDLVETIEHGIPAAQASIATDLAEVTEMIGKGTRWAYAFLDIAPRDLSTNTVVQTLAQAGTKVVLLGHAAEEAIASTPFPVLVRPFSTSDVFDALGLDIPS